MENTNNNSSVERFNILFEKLAEAKAEQQQVFNLNTQEMSETYNTIALFKEFQDSINVPSYSTFTRS
jgi:hypothetical protein